jgi:hypothetical protein
MRWSQKSARTGATDRKRTPLLATMSATRHDRQPVLCPPLEAGIGHQAYMKRLEMRRTGPSGPDRLRPQSLPLIKE